MGLTSEQFIDNAYETGFWWIACQLGASEFQVAAITGHSFMEVRNSNRHIGQLLAFPYHDGHSKETPMSYVQELYDRWTREQRDNATLQHPITLNHFRLLTDPYLEHTHE